MLQRRVIQVMPRIAPREFYRLPLRVHQFLAGVPLHDVWAVDLPRTRQGITLDQFLRAAHGRPFKPSRVVRALLGIRFLVGGLLGWDRGCERRFHTVYQVENEQLLEVINRTVHADALTALVETGNAYRLYFAIYVRSVGRLTPVYMALIDPFRRFIVYPSLLRSVRATWDEAFGTIRSGTAGPPAPGADRPRRSGSSR